MRVSRPASSGVLILLLILLLPLISGCRQQITAERVPALLQDKIAHLQSYQLALSISQASGVKHELQQWYKAPASLRTDVLQAGQPLYRFLLRSGGLTCQSFADGLTSDLPGANDNALFLQPLLLSLWQESLTATFQEDGQCGTFSTELEWQGLDGRPHSGRLVLGAKSLLPVALHLFSGEPHLELTIEFIDIALSPTLDDGLFKP